MTWSATEASPRPKGWRLLFCADHKVVALQYALTALVLLFLAFCMVLVMRWQLAYPGDPFPFIGKWFGPNHPWMPDGIMVPNFYYQLASLHGTIMVFFAVVPLLLGGF